jgi:hypothetical protein
MYEKLPLDSSKREIRLLRVLPGVFNETVQCELLKASLENPPKYRALSYVWGNPTLKKQAISVDGQEVWVTANLKHALRRLRSHSGQTAFVLWVDAICINQLDRDEVGEQIAIMGRIYSSCTEACIWLGPLGCEHIEESWNFDIKRDNSSGSTTFPRFENAHDPKTASGIMRCAYALSQLALGAHLLDIEPFVPGSEIHFDVMFQAMKGILTSPWFERVWVVQEARLAAEATIYIGNISISAATLWQSHASFHSKRHKENCPDCRGSEEQAPLISTMENLFRKLLEMVFKNPNPEEHSGEWHKSPTGPLELLMEFALVHRRRKCAVDADRLYAYLGIVESVAGAMPLTPDMNLTPPELYLSLCCKAVTKGRSLRFMCWGTAKNKYPGLPSWVIDWTNNASPHEFMWLPVTKGWDATGGMALDASVEDGKVLVASGLEFDKVSMIGQLWDNEGKGLYDSSLWESWRKVAGLPGSADQLYPSDDGINYREAWWKFLCFESQNAEYKWSQRTIAAFEFIATIMPHCDLNWDYQVTKACQECEFPGGRESIEDLFLVTTKPIWGNLPHFHGDRRLFRTEKGYLGSCRSPVRDRDRLFLLSGCPAPLILREIPGETHDGEQLYTLVSEAFVFGIMDGEIFQGEKTELLKKVSIR